MARWLNDTFVAGRPDQRANSVLSDPASPPKGAPSPRHKRGVVVLGITESAIHRYGAPLLARWAYLRHRCSNGVVYGGFDERRAAKLGWGRSKFYATMAALCDAGLARKNREGHYALRTTRSLRGGVKHKCSLLIPHGASERQIQDLLHLKLVEMGHRQRLRRELPPRSIKEAARRERVALLENNQRFAETKILCRPLLGEAKESIEESALNGWAPMNTKKLLKLTGMGRAALFAWKKRARTAGWIEQQNRSEPIPMVISACFPDMIRDTEIRYRGAVSMCPGGYRFHQASTYRMTMNYTSP